MTGAGQGASGNDDECNVAAIGILPGSFFNGGFGGTAGDIGGFGGTVNPCTGDPGSLGQGGSNDTVCDPNHKGGGGGGGYWGGGGGCDGNRGGGGGGAGSSFRVPGARTTSMHFSKRNLQPEVAISPAH